MDSAGVVAAVQAKLRAHGYIEDVNGNQIERVLSALLIYTSIIGSTCNCKQQLPLAWRKEPSHDNNYLKMTDAYEDITRDKRPSMPETVYFVRPSPPSRTRTLRLVLVVTTPSPPCRVSSTDTSFGLVSMT